MNASTIASIVAAIAMGIAAWFANNVANLNGRVDTVQVQTAGTSQAIIDIQARTTRIEDILDKQFAPK